MATSLVYRPSSLESSNSLSLMRCRIEQLSPISLIKGPPFCCPPKASNRVQTGLILVPASTRNLQRIFLMKDDSVSDLHKNVYIHSPPVQIMKFESIKKLTHSLTVIRRVMLIYFCYWQISSSILFVQLHAVWITSHLKIESRIKTQLYRKTLQI